MGAKIKYICIEQCTIPLDECNCEISINETIYLTFVYKGAFADRYLIYLTDDENSECVGSLFNDNLKNFQEYREHIIDKVLKIDKKR